MDINKVAAERFGIRSLKKTQAEAISHVLMGRDLVMVLGTGGGKSLCYQLPAIVGPGVTIVVSPLISLMQDQVSKLLQRGIPAAAINGYTSSAARQNIFSLIRSGELKIVYVTPEQLTKETNMLALAKLHLSSTRISRVVIDEAHCVSMWGHDFRPSYLKIRKAVDAIQAYINKRVETSIHIPISAFTATATDAVRSDLKNIIFNNRDVYDVSDSVVRPNLSYESQNIPQKEKKLDSVINILNESDGATIIYCSTIKQCNNLHAQLESMQLGSTIYHSQLNHQTKNSNQKSWISGEKRIIVATSAFGMGIDKSDVRTIIHYQIPGSIDDYQQESGRAGRDGKPSRCVLLFNEEDVDVRRLMIDCNYPTEVEFNAFLVYFSHKLNANNNEPISIDIDAFKGAIGNRIHALTIEAIIKELEVCGCLSRHGDQYDFANKEIRPDFDMLQNRRMNQHQLLNTIVDFAYTSECKASFIADYYSEKSIGDCGKCTSCMQKQANITLIENGIPHHPVEDIKDNQVIEDLTKLRNVLSKELSAPPMSIFTEHTLKQIVSERPKNITELSQIKGMTNAKVNKFGSRILATYIKDSNQAQHDVDKLSDDQVEAMFKTFIMKEVRAVNRDIVMK